MSCELVLLDGAKLLVSVEPGEKLTEEDKKSLEEYVRFCRERRDKIKRKVVRG